MLLSPSTALAAILARISRPKFLCLNAALLFLLEFFQTSDFFAETKANMFNVLWALVFGFSTLNILGLAFRRFDSRKMGLNFGELLAITVVIFSIILFGSELLGLLHIFPVQLTPR
jgi:hypothetical protein